MPNKSAPPSSPTNLSNRHNERRVPGTLDEMRDVMQNAIDTLSQEENVPAIGAKTQLLRPLVTGILAEEFSPLPGASLLSPNADKNFLRAVTALQVIHEASLYHDDVIDEGKYRRGEMTLPPQVGNRLAVMQGDRFIAAAFKLIAECASVPLMQDFARTIEGIINGEVLQNQNSGKLLSWEVYEQVNQLKTGGLFAFGARLPYYFLKAENMEEMNRLILDLGTLYQYIDDCLDYNLCTQTGKPPYQDFRAQKWTLGLRKVDGFSWGVSMIDFWRMSYKVTEKITSSPSSTSSSTRSSSTANSKHARAAHVLRSPFAEAVEYCLDEINELRARVQAMFQHTSLLDDLLVRWEKKLIAARQAEEEALAGHIRTCEADGLDPNDSLSDFLQSCLNERAR